MAPTSQPQLNIQQLSQSLSRAMGGGLFNAASSAFQNTKETRNYIVSIDTSFKRTEKAISSINRTIQAQINSNKFSNIESELEKNRNMTGDAFNRLEKSLAGILSLLESMGGQQQTPPGGFPTPPPGSIRRPGSGAGPGRKPSTPYRDPKTGRFAKRGSGAGPGRKPSTPFRNPKTGRFTKAPTRPFTPTPTKPPGFGPTSKGPFSYSEALDEGFRPNPRGKTSFKLPSGKTLELTQQQFQRFASSRSAAVARGVRGTTGFLTGRLLGPLALAYTAGLEAWAGAEQYGIAYALHEMKLITDDEFNSEVRYIVGKYVSRLALGLAFAAVFAKIGLSAGAGVGAGVGALGGGVGAIPGAVIGSTVGGVGGGVVGGYLGYELGAMVAENLVDLLTGRTTFAKLFNQLIKKYEVKATTEQNSRGLTGPNVLGYQPTTDTAQPINILGYGSQNPETMEKADRAPRSILGYGAENFVSQDQKYEGPPGERMTAGRVEELQQQVAAIRRQPISGALRRVLESAAQAAGVNVQVTSGGQPNISTGSTNRTGSTRHDDGNAADLQLYVVENGKKRILSDTNAEDRQIMSKFVSAAIGAGATGVGAAHDYMGPSTMHVGFGNPAVWGGSSGPASWIRAAAAGIGQRGTEAKDEGAAGVPGQVAPPAPTPSLESPDEMTPGPSSAQPLADRVSMADPVSVDNTKKPQSDFDPQKYSLASFIGDVGKHESMTADAFTHLYGGGFGALA